jgi:hypothetical protein
MSNFAQRRTFRFGFSDLEVDASQIEGLLGEEQGENRKVITELIDEVLLDAEKICDIKAEYIIIPEIKSDTNSKTIIINSQEFNIGKIVWTQLKRSETVALFLCTAGEKIGEVSRELIGGKDFLKGYIYDVAGSEIVEAAADTMQKKLMENMQLEGLLITNRFSPGYCGWDVSEQHKLFQLIPDNFCGIRLTESALMIPIKSISGIIGIGRNVKFNPYTCSLCDYENCIFRKLKETRPAL